MKQFLFLFCALLLAGEEFSALQARMLKRATLSLDFIERKPSKLRRLKKTNGDSTTLNARGRVYFKQDGRFVWRYLDTNNDYIYDGERLYYHQRDLKHVSVFNRGGAQMRELTDVVQVVRDIKQLTSRYEVPNFIEAAGIYKGLLVAKDQRAIIREIDVEFDRLGAFPRSIELRSGEGPIRSVTFSNPGEEQPSDGFIFKDYAGLKKEVFD